MPLPSTPTAVVLGAAGRFGREATAAFCRAGWQVIAQNRSAIPPSLPENAVPLQCDALDTAKLIEACARKADVIVHALNPPYTEWEKHVPPLTGSVLELAQASAALLMLPGNVYNFGCRLPAVLDEDTPQVADTSKAAVRIALEEQMRAAAERGVRSVVIRAGDFIGGPGPGTWLDLVIAARLRRRKAVYPGAMDVAHAWAYLPDLAEVFVAVAQRRAALPGFDVFHYEGLTLTGTQLCDALDRAVGHPLARAGMPWWLLRLASPAVPMFRALLEMRYLWERPHRLVESKLRGFIGEVPHTPIDRVLRDTPVLKI